MNAMQQWVELGGTIFAMIKVSILYPYSAEAAFDFDYYIRKHMPRSIQLLSAHPGFHGVSVERGVGGTDSGSSLGYVAACFYTFDSIESFISAFMPHAIELQSDMVSCTSIEPHIQFNEILIDRSVAT